MRLCAIAVLICSLSAAAHGQVTMSLSGSAPTDDIVISNPTGTSQQLGWRYRPTDTVARDMGQRFLTNHGFDLQAFTVKADSSQGAAITNAAFELKVYQFDSAGDFSFDNADSTSLIYQQSGTTLATAPVDGDYLTYTLDAPVTLEPLTRYGVTLAWDAAAADRIIRLERGGDQVSNTEMVALQFDATGGGTQPGSGTFDTGSAVAGAPSGTDLVFYAQATSDWVDPSTAWTRHTIEQGSASRNGADGGRLGDFSGDGVSDLVVGFEESGITRAYVRPTGAAVTSPWTAVTVGSSPDVEDAFFVDVDGDGRLDVVTSEETGTGSSPAGNVRVHFAPTAPGDVLNSANWSSSAITAAAGVTEWMFGLGLDIDGTNGTDLVVAGKNTNQTNGSAPSSTLGWLAAPADPRANPGGWTYHEIDKVGWTMSVIDRDMDGDGDLDILISDRRGSDRGVRWLENPTINPAGVGITDPWNAHTVGATGEEVMLITVADITGDGLDDIFVPTRSADLLWYEAVDATGDNWIEHMINAPADFGNLKAVEVADVDGDGQLDIILTAEDAVGDSGLVWLSYLNDPTDTDWLRYEISGIDGSKFDLMQLLDLDGDGDLDVITTEEGDSSGTDDLGVVWYENPFDPVNPIPEPTTATLLALTGLALLRRRRAA